MEGMEDVAAARMSLTCTYVSLNSPSLPINHSPSLSPPALSSLSLALSLSVCVSHLSHLSLPPSLCRSLLLSILSVALAPSLPLSLPRARFLSSLSLVLSLFFLSLTLFRSPTLSLLSHSFCLSLTFSRDLSRALSLSLSLPLSLPLSYTHNTHTHNTQPTSYMHTHKHTQVPLERQRAHRRWKM